MKYKYIDGYRKLLREAPTREELIALFETDSFFDLEDSKFHHEHGELIDEIAGISSHNIESDLLTTGIKLNPRGDVESWGKRMHQGHQTWVGLDPNVLQTPYAEIFDMLTKIDPGKNQHIVDLGAAYGRMGLVLNYLYPETFFTGFEYVPERVIEGNRVFVQYLCHRALLIQADLSSETFTLPEADIYFLYDYGRPDQIRFTLKELERIGEKKNIIVVGRGTACRHYIHKSHPWLSQIFDIYHRNEFSIYSNYRDL